MLEIGVEEVHERLGQLHLIDIREQDEVEICGLPGAEHLPMMELFCGLKRTQARQDAEIVVFCHTGLRSIEATNYLRMQGFSSVRSMAGGIDAWAERIDSSMPRY